MTSRERRLRPTRSESLRIARSDDRFDIVATMPLRTQQVFFLSSTLALYAT